MESPPLSRRERERLVRREAILDAARAVFAEKGYTHATLEEIAQRAEFGKGTLYNYFPGGKEALLFAIFDELYDAYHRLAAVAFAPAHTTGRSVRDVFHGFILENLRFFRSRQDLFMILVKEAHRMTFGDDEEKALYFIRQHERAVTALVPPLEAAMTAGHLKPLQPHAVAHMLLGSINGVNMHTHFRAGQEGLADCDAVEDAYTLPSEEHLAAFLTTMLFDGLLA